MQKGIAISPLSTRGCGLVMFVFLKHKHVYDHDHVLICLCGSGTVVVMTMGPMGVEIGDSFDQPEFDSV